MNTTESTTMKGNPATSYSKTARTHRDPHRCGECGHADAYCKRGGCSATDPEGRTCPCRGFRKAAR